MKGHGTRSGSQDRVSLSRRGFLGGAAALSVVPRRVLGGAEEAAPSESLPIAAIGVGDQGTRDMQTFLAMKDVRIVAVCDVDAGNRDRAKSIVERAGSACAAYNDFRELLDKEKAVEAVLVVTPDHTHAMISIAAMRLGKHVYCQKPLTHTVYEARKIAEVARATKVATQLGTVNQASEESRVIREMIWGGAIGPVREVHNWSNRPIWPQGIDRPADTPPVPAGLDWDLWLGPAPLRPYHPIYLPLVWRGWWDFGTSAVGDMGCYSFDTIFRALKLGAPRSVQATAAGFAPRMWSPLVWSDETYPRASVVRYEFPAREDMPPASLTWYDGGLRPPIPEEFEGADLAIEGLLFAGEKGKLLCDFTGGRPRLLPDARAREFQLPPKTIPRSIGHHREWIEACKGGPPAGACFEFSGPVTEALILGNVAVRARKKLLWDPAAFQVTNVPEANRYLHYEYRKPWTIEG